MPEQKPAKAPRPPRVMIYSHDTFGLGHIRRARTIANALAHELGASVLIVTGSPVVGNFDYAAGIDYVRLPGVVKQPDGSYVSRALNVSLDRSVAMREAIIRETAQSFDPDILIVDKEPTGFRGEMVPTIEMLRERGARIVIGIRDVLDEPEAIRIEWERKGARNAILRLYDEILVYGLRAVHEPLAVLDLPPEVEDKICYTGYLRRDGSAEPTMALYPAITRGDFLLVTAGGGGDGAALMNWVISAYECDTPPELPALLVYGPFIPRDRRRDFTARIAKLPKVEALAFDARLEWLMARAAGVVAMGGYNTFCEILSLDCKALIVPRAKPRLEQTIRARRAAELGLCSILEEPLKGKPSAKVMAEALTALPHRDRPSVTASDDLLDGVPAVVALVRRWMTEKPLRQPRLRVAG